MYSPVGQFGHDMPMKPTIRRTCALQHRRGRPQEARHFAEVFVGIGTSALGANVVA